MFVVLYRTGGAGTRLRKYTIGPYGRVTLHQAQVAAQKVFSAKLEGRDPAGEKREAKRRVVADRVDDLLEAYIAQHVSQRRSGGEISRLLRREIGKAWGSRSIHEITKRDVVEVITAIEQRGAPVAANKTLKTLKTFLRWCVGRAVLDQSPADGVPLPTKEISRDRVLVDDELARVITAARKIGGPYGGIVELLALTAQRREEVAGASSDELDIGQRIWTLPKGRTKNGKPHIVHLSNEAIVVLNRANKIGPFVFSIDGAKPFQEFSRAKRKLDELSGVTGWRLHDLRRTCVSGMAPLATNSRNDRKQRPHFLAWIRSAHDAAHDRNADRAGCQDFGGPRGIESPNGKNRYGRRTCDLGEALAADLGAIARLARRLEGGPSDCIVNDVRIDRLGLGDGVE